MSTTYIGEAPAPGMAFIYSLRETSDGPRRYIGSTSTTLHDRARRHYHKMLERFPVMVVELIVPVERQKLHEQQMIDACRACGLVLENKINAVPQCGTVSGRSAHLRRAEKPCESCRTAEREYERKLGGHKPFRPAQCGTSGGHRAHYRRGEKPCPDCRVANAEACRRQSAKRKENAPR